MTLDYLYIFLQTTLIELPFYWFFLRAHLSLKKLVLVVLAINACTHPLVFFGLMALPLAPVVKIAISESFAPAFEAWALVYFLRVPWRQALKASIVANLASWQLGPIVTYWLYF
jgi:hypothetical protein